MSINQPTPPTEFESVPLEQPDGFIDRLLIGIGDMVIRNFTFLVIITVVWGIITLIFFGGIALVYTVSERFRDIEGREQQRQILHEQQLNQIVLSAPADIQDARKWDDTVWFSALSDTVESTQSADADELDSGDFGLNVSIQKPSPRLNQHLIEDDRVWQIDCGDVGFVYEGSYPCPITNASLLGPDAVANDPAASN